MAKSYTPSKDITSNPMLLKAWGWAGSRTGGNGLLSAQHTTQAQGSNPVDFIEKSGFFTNRRI